MQPPVRNAKARPALLAPALAAITFLTFSPLFRAGFVDWDDPENLSQNARLLAPGIGGATYYWSHPGLDLYIPVTEFAWWLLSRLQPLEPALFHSANLVVHAASAIVVFAILRNLVRNDWAAVAGALLFALHPLQVETVAWVSGLKDLLSGFFGLLALWIFIHPPTASRKLNRFAGLIALSLALLCKPSAMVVPVVAALIAVLCQRRATRRVLVELIPWFLVAGTAAIIARIVQPASLIATLIPVWSRPFIAGDSLAFYFWKLIAPFGIVVDYGRKYPGIFNNPPHYAYWIWTIPTLILTLLWLNRRKWPMVWASALMFLAGLTPMLGLVPFEYQSYSNLADHYVYIAMLGPSLAVAAILATHNKLAIASAPAVLLLLATLSYRQTQVWLNDQDLFTHLQEVIPDNWVASHHLFRDALARDDYSEAETQARRFISQSPADAMAYFDLGQALRYQGHTSEAQSEFQTAMGIDPNSVPPIIGLAGLYEDEHRFDLAIALYRQALTLDPQNPDALTGLADSLEESQARPASQP